MASRAEARSERVTQAVEVLEAAFGVPQADAHAFLTSEAWPTFSSFARPGGVNKFFVFFQPREVDVRGLLHMMAPGRRAVGRSARRRGRLAERPGGASQSQRPRTAMLAPPPLPRSPRLTGLRPMRRPALRLLGAARGARPRVRPGRAAAQFDQNALSDGAANRRLIPSHSPGVSLPSRLPLSAPWHVARATRAGCKGRGKYRGHQVLWRGCWHRASAKLPATAAGPPRLSS